MVASLSTDGGSLYLGVLVPHALLIAVEDLVFLSSVGGDTRLTH